MFEFTLPAVPFSIPEDIHERVEDQLQRTNRPQPNQKYGNPIRVETSAIHRYQSQAAVEGFNFLMDEPRSGGGTGTAPAPMRYFLAGILGCVEVWIINISSVNNVPIQSLRCQAESFAERGTDEERPFGLGLALIELTIFINTDWENDQDEKIQEVVAEGVRRCRAAVTVSRGTELRIATVHNGSALDKFQVQHE